MDCYSDYIPMSVLVGIHILKYSSGMTGPSSLTKLKEDLPLICRIHLRAVIVTDQATSREFSRDWLSLRFNRYGTMVSDPRNLLGITLLDLSACVVCANSCSIQLLLTMSSPRKLITKSVTVHFFSYLWFLLTSTSFCSLGASCTSRIQFVKPCRWSVTPGWLLSQLTCCQEGGNRSYDHLRSLFL